MAATFQGFEPAAFDFLVELALNNERGWFQPRKAEYERLLKRPLEELCSALDDAFRARDLPLSSDPARSPFRIYRDVRFAKDKSPYKTNVGASFPWAGEGRGVGGYFHFEPGNAFVGGGMWHPAPARLAAWRSAVVTERARVHEAVDDPGFRDEFGAVGGDRLTRAPSGYAPDDPDLELLKLKDVTFGRPLADEEVLSPRLPETIAESLAAAVPLLRLLATLPGEEEPARWLRR